MKFNNNLRNFAFFSIFISTFSYGAENRVVNLTLLNGLNENFDINDTEVYSQETFKKLMEDKFAVGLPYILARVETSVGGRDFVHYFDASGLYQDIINRIWNPLNPINRAPINDVQVLQINDMDPNSEFKYLFSLQDLMSPQDHYLASYFRNNFNNVVLPPREHLQYIVDNWNNPTPLDKSIFLNMAFNQNTDLVTKAVAATWLYKLYSANQNHQRAIEYLNYAANQNDDQGSKVYATYMLGLGYLQGNNGLPVDSARAYNYLNSIANVDANARNLLANDPLLLNYQRDTNFNTELAKITQIAKRLNNQKNLRAKAKNKKRINTRIQNLKRELVQSNFSLKDSNDKTIFMVRPYLLSILCDLPQNLAKQLVNETDAQGFRVKKYLIDSNIARKNPILFIKLTRNLNNCGKLRVKKANLQRLKDRIGNKKWLAIANAVSKLNK